jgi:fatty-acyl-CoA synthase
MTTRELRPPVRSNADLLAIEQIPLIERSIPATVLDLLTDRARSQPDDPALSYIPSASAMGQGGQYSYTRLLNDVLHTANQLNRHLQGSRVVTVMLPNIPEMQHLMWGAQIAGTVNPINPMLDPAGIAHLLREADTEILVTVRSTPTLDFFERAVAALDDAPKVHTILVIDLDPRLDRRTRSALTMARLGRLARRSQPRYPRTVHPFSTAARRPGVELEFAKDADPDRVSALFHTGGTTGLPKIAKLTQRNLMFAAWAASLTNRPDALGPCTSMLLALPLYHVNAVVVGSLLPWMLGAGTTIATPQGFRAPGLLEALPAIADRFAVTTMTAVPTVYARLLDLHATTPLTPLVVGVSGAAPAPRGLLQRVENELGLTVVEGFGMTETSCIASTNPLSGLRKSESVGMRLPYTDIRIVDPGAPQDKRPVGQVGEVLIRGPHLFAGYTTPEHDATTWHVDSTGIRWLRTGDLGFLDEDEYLFLSGRIKELIIRGGHNIDPATIENVLDSHPSVRLSAAVPRPDADVGEVPVAYVELEPGSACLPAELLMWSRKQMSDPAAVPRRITVLEALPLTPIGKVFKPGLVADEIKDALRSTVQALPGVVTTGVSITNGPHGGRLAQVRVSAQSPSVEQTVADELGRFAVSWDLVFTVASGD